MTEATKRAVFVTAVILGTIYLALFYLAIDGYGYAGRGGFGTRSSAWYWGEAETYHERSNRAGSVDGTNPLGGGPESGK